MEITTTTVTRNPARRAAINGLAIVGFIALIIIGIALAIYSASFVPKAISRIGAAAVSLSSVFTHDDGSDLQVVPQIPFDDALTASSTTATSTAATTTSPSTIPSAPVVVSPVVPVQSFYGNPDLTVAITGIGYFAVDGNASTFISTDNIPDGKDGVVKYRVTNIGTNVAAPFDIEIEAETSGGTDTDSVRSPSLNPSRSIDGYGTFDANRNGNIDITLTVDSSNEIRENLENNNEATENADVDD